MARHARGKTHLLAVIDGSGSMNAVVEDVRGGFNGYMAGIATDSSHEYEVTLSLFNTEVTTLCVGAPLRDVPELDTSNYRPRGNTALLDAIGKTIISFEGKWVQTGLPKADRVLMVIYTDGLENSSSEYSPSTIRLMIDARDELQGWNYVYLGAGLDSWQQARSMGLPAQNYVNTRGDRAGTRSTFSSLTGSTVSYAGGASVKDVAEQIRKQAGKPDDAA